MKMNSLRKASRIDFDAIDISQIQRILKTEDLSSLTQAERTYFDMMEMVRGLRARMIMPGGKHITSKAGIIRLLKSDAYGLSDWMARRVYEDAINFFYAEDGVRADAWRNLYAEKLEKLADLSASMGKLQDARKFIVEAAKLRGCYDNSERDIPQTLLEAAPVVIYSADPMAMGAAKTDRKQLEMFIDSIPDLPEVSRLRIKEDAGIEPTNLLQRMYNDIKDFGDGEE